MSKVLRWNSSPTGSCERKGRTAAGDIKAVSTTSQLVAQADTNCSMLAAGMGSVYICADLLGGSPAMTSRGAQKNRCRLPFGRVAYPSRPRAARSARKDQHAAAHGDDRPWTRLDGEELRDRHRHPSRYYYLYGLERYKSFQEAFEGARRGGAEVVQRRLPVPGQGSKSGRQLARLLRQQCDTAFCALFLLRSTQKSMRIDLGEGTLLSGRGLPTNLAGPRCATAS